MRSCWSVSPQSAVGTSLLPPLLLCHYHNLWSGGWKQADLPVVCWLALPFILSHTLSLSLPLFFTLTLALST